MGGGKLRELIMSRLHPAKRGGGGGTVPRGHFAVYVGDSRTRFVVPTAYLRHPAFLALLETAEEEFGYGGGGISIPCSEQDFAALVGRLGSSSPSSSSSSSWH